MKKLLRQYGLMFSVSYAICFFILVTFSSKLNSSPIPGDIFIRTANSKFYLPLVSSGLISLGILAVFGIYKQIK